MEAAIEKIRAKYPKCEVERSEDGKSVFIDNCGRPCEREDHYMCANSFCKCYKNEGWCHTWYDNECAPVIEKFKTWARENMPAGIEAECDIDEKGYRNVRLSLVVVAEPQVKKIKTA